MNLKQAILERANENSILKQGLVNFYARLESMPGSMSSFEFTNYSIVKLLYDSTKDEFLTRIVLNDFTTNDPKILVTYYYYEDEESEEIEEVPESLIYSVIKKEGCGINLITGALDKHFLEHVNVVYKLNEVLLNGNT